MQKRIRHLHGFALSLALVVGGTGSAVAQEDDSERDMDYDVAQEDDSERDMDYDEDSRDGPEGEASREDFPIEVRNRADEAPPEPPSPLLDEQTGAMEVSQNAGLGGDVAYGRQSVLEIGGAVGFVNFSETTSVSISPFIGYFVFDGLQLSLLPTFTVIHIKGEDPSSDNPTGSDSQTDATFTVVLEPSYHLALTDEVFVFLGTGVGVVFSQDPVADFLFRPRVGADFVIGRSAILKPSLYLDVGAANGYAGIGAQAAFSAMW